MTEATTQRLKPSTRRRLATLAKALAGIAVLTWVLREMDWGNFLVQVREISWPRFAVLVLLATVDRFAMAYKWNLLLRAIGISIRTPRIVALYLVGTLLGAFTPGGLGGDAYRVVALRPLGKSAAVFSTVVLERAVGVLSVLIFVIAALPLSMSYFGADARPVAAVGVAGLVVVLALLILPLSAPVRRWAERRADGPAGRVAKQLQKILDAYSHMQRNRRAMLTFFALTILETAYFFFLNYLAIRTAGVDISLTFVFLVIPMVQFILRLPISIQGIGIQEGLFAYALGLAGFSIAEGVIVSLVWRLSDVVVVYIPACFLLWLSPMTYRSTTAD